MESAEPQTKITLGILFDGIGGEPTQEQKDFAHWVNKKSVFSSCAWSDFRPRKACKKEDQ